MSAATGALTTGSPLDAAEDGYGSPGRSQWLDIDWRPHLRSLTLHGSRVNYVEIGTGSPLVFVHGLAGCWQNWLENIPHFANSHRVIALDLAGFGESELPHEDISIPGYGRFVDAFLRKGRFTEMLREMPIDLIIDEKVGLRGAAEMARRIASLKRPQWD